MERKLLTVEDLVGLDEISAEDKALIENQVTDAGGCATEGPDTVLHMAIRGYLATTFTEVEPDAKDRADLGNTAASFSDGWTWCEMLGKKPV